MRSINKRRILIFFSKLMIRENYLLLDSLRDDHKKMSTLITESNLKPKWYLLLQIFFAKVVFQKSDLLKIHSAPLHFR